MQGEARQQTMDAYTYELPDEAIAQEPVEPRDAARLLVAPDGQPPVDRHVRDLPQLLEPGDLVVVNDTKVLPARLHLRKVSGGEAEVLLLRQADALTWEALVRPGRRLPPGTVLFDGTTPVIEVGDAQGDVRIVRLLADPWSRGEIPLPPYIRRPLADPDRYQTVYAAHPGSAAAPTAGLHLTQAVLDGCRKRDVGIATIDLAVGLDTFRPITTDDPGDHKMHEEAYRVPAETWAACRAASRVIAVGTTTLRALETTARTGQLEGRTDLFIRDGFRFAVVDILLTNFHLPRSTLLLLVEAFIGDRWRDLYGTALDRGYRFLSFGDAMLLGRR
ncbi:MAG: tRNA preQ1(34) S-adenosylmethionine ribosyltransferase-isomerase QueA [Acidimicrobiales bacterium]